MRAGPFLHFALLGCLSACTGGTTAVDPDGGDPGGQNADPAVLALEDLAFALVNDERVAMAAAPLQHDGTLREVARAHSEDMVARSFFAHVNPDNQDPFDRMAAAGVTFSAAGENIAWNMGYADPAGTAVTGWMNSSGHRANILNGNFVRTGMGVAIAPDGAVYFTQVFTRPTGNLVLGGWIADGDEGDAADDLGASSWRIRGQ